MAREQFTFYRSYWEAAKLIKKPADRLSLLEAIAAYALDEEEKKLTDVAAPNFLLIKPTLDASAKKAKAGCVGGSRKQTGSKVEATGKQNGSKPGGSRKQTGSKVEATGKQNGSKPGGSRKQTGREKEDEVEDEVEIEDENECSNSSPSGEEAGAHARNSSPAGPMMSHPIMIARTKQCLLEGYEPSEDLRAWMDLYPAKVEDIRRSINAGRSGVHNEN